MLKILTPTGGRPKALRLLNEYLERQTFQDFMWIVLDDCEPTCEIPSRCDRHIVPEWTWDGENTQHKCMLRLLEEIGPDDSVLICEDDDWYSCYYVEKMNDMLKTSDLVGQMTSVYYNIRNRTYKHFKNKDHACLCQTGFKGGVVDVVKNICLNDNSNIDSELWRACDGTLSNCMNVVGIKGMAGRDGIGIGHKLDGIKDDHSYLESLIGDDAKNYVNRFYICASGPSLTKDDVDLLENEDNVIVINNTYQLAPWASILYACDAAWWEAYPEALEFIGHKASILYNHPMVKKYDYCGASQGLGEDKIHSCGNSGHQAINLAYLLGATEIVLLGYDMQRTDGQLHWHGDHERGLSQPGSFKQWVNHIRILGKHLEEKGVNVINCSRQTAIDCFERKDIRDVV